MAGGELGAAGGPVHAFGDKLFTENHGVVLPPGDGLPAVLWQDREDRLGLIQRRWARLLGLATPSRMRRPHERGGAHLVWQADAKGAADAHHVGDLAVVEALQKSGVSAVASVGHDPGKRHAPRPGLID